MLEAALLANSVDDRDPDATLKCFLADAELSLRIAF